jgi:hypothetical protein
MTGTTHRPARLRTAHGARGNRRRQGRRACCHAMIAGAPHGVILQRDLQRRLNRFGASRHEHHPVESGATGVGHPLAKFLERVTREGVPVAVRDPVELTLDRAVHLFVAVAEAKHGGSAGRVDVALPVRVEDVQALAIRHLRQGRVDPVARRTGVRRSAGRHGPRPGSWPVFRTIAAPSVLVAAAQPRHRTREIVLG